MDSEDGQVFVKNLAQFVRTHEKALANALQLRRQASKDGRTSVHARDASPGETSKHGNGTMSSTSSALAAALSLGTLKFSSHDIKPAKLALTPHHLYYLLDRFEEAGIPVGPMNVRLENIHTEASPTNYVSFLGQSQRSRGRSDRDSIHSVSSVRSVITGMSNLWSGLGLGSSTSAAKTEKARAQLLIDLKYLYSAFTKIPCLRLSPDRKARLIGGYEEFPFDTAVPLLAFKNVSAMEICDIDFRQFYGWDKISEQLRSLTVKRSNLEDPTDLFVNIVLDDMDKRRRRSSKVQSSPVLAWPSSPSIRFDDAGPGNVAPSSPGLDVKLGQSTSPKTNLESQHDSGASVLQRESRTKSASPSRPGSSRQDGSYRHVRANAVKVKRSGSGSSSSSTHSIGPYRSGSSSNILTMGILPASKWRFLRHLSLADNSLTSMAASSLAPLSNTLHSLDLSSNLFAEIPDSLAALTALRALNVSNCMIESLHSLARIPLPAVTALNLRANRLDSIAGVERLASLERLDLRDNKLQDPTELARLTGIPNVHDIYVIRNPFIKTHANYRVTILNLFRNTPGYLEDVLIDGSGPGFGERRQLKDRMVEPQIPIVHRVSVEPDRNLLSKLSITKESALEGDHRVKASRSEGEQRPAYLETQSEFNIGSGRRRKGPRRRIVDLSRDESPASLHPVPLEAPHEFELPKLPFSSIDTVSVQSKPSFPSAAYTQPGGSSLQQTSSSHSPNRDPVQVSDKGRSLASEIQSSNLNAEAYRQKVEALKNEVGSNWLSLLREESWNQQLNINVRDSQYTNLRLNGPEISTIQAVSQSIVSDSRMLG